MLFKIIILAVLCTLVKSSAVYTVYKNSMVDGQTCEDYLQKIEETFFNNSIYSARLEERLECKEKELSCEKDICDIKLNSDCNENPAEIENLEQKLLTLESENKRIWGLVNEYSQGSSTGLVHLPSVGEFAFTDCGEGAGASLLDILKTSHKRYYTPNPHFSYSWHTFYMNWTQAYNYCKNCGLRLASFETQSEFDELDHLFTYNYWRAQQSGRFHTGAFRHKNGTHDVFTWLNGQTINLSNDSYFEINNQISDQINTMYLYMPNNPYYGYDSPYNRTLYFMYGASSEGAAPLCETF